ncbi:MAG: metallophosphoesterase family protein [Calditrichaceae bacterium]|jgi:diadenosine tetraphosphatase ApaH/serine/threonine PP2A family protein phosphatase
MAIAILSDIHSNLEALRAAFDYIGQNDIEKVYCLGDIVGYGPNPNECVELIRDRCEIILMGNHDYAAIGQANIEYFNEYAKMSTRWTIEQLNKENFEFLKGLPFSHQTDDMLLVHSSPSNPSHWYYVLSVQDARIEMQSFSEHICLIGHSHVPVVFSGQNFNRERTQKLNPDRKYIINVGSVGQPRDGNPNPCFAVLDLEGNNLEYIRLEYDINTTHDKIVKAGLPLFLAERLLKGY